jgi:hypothetical protein
VPIHHLEAKPRERHRPELRCRIGHWIATVGCMVISANVDSGHTVTALVFAWIGRIFLLMLALYHLRAGRVGS